jgi:tRNA U34 5-carboxymethylaminomethyl modifying GTPase MnmE/TrmE
MGNLPPSPLSLLQKEVNDSNNLNAELKTQLEELIKNNDALQKEYEHFKIGNKTLQTNYDNMVKEFACAHIEVLEKQNIDNYESRMEKAFEKFLKTLSDNKTSVKKTIIPSIAVVGPVGVGKSSLINKLAGHEVTAVGEVDTTTDITKVYQGNGIEFWDVPSSDKQTYCNLFHIMQIKQMHLIIICYTERIKHIIDIEQLIMACGTPYICLRNKCELKDPLAAFNVEKNKINGDLYYCSCANNTGFDELKAEIFARTSKVM